MRPQLLILGPPLDQLMPLQVCTAHPWEQGNTGVVARDVGRTRQAYVLRAFPFMSWHVRLSVWRLQMLMK